MAPAVGTDALRERSARPNIIFIHAESMDGRKMGCMGHAPLRSGTPHLDALAADGVLFRNAYTNCPVCNPSRASMWTGKYPDYYNCWNNHEGIREHVPIFRHVFDRTGYETAAIGPLDYAYGLHSIRDRIGSWTRAARIQRPISRTPLPQVVGNGKCDQGDWRRVDQAVEWLRHAATSDKPFMLYLTTGLVHPAFIADREHMARVDADAIEIPPTIGPLEGATHPVDRYIRMTKNCANAFSEARVREIRHVYFAMIAALDDMIGRVLRAVDDLGLRESTYIVFSSDHGEMAGEHNQILKRTMSEPSTHVPLIVRGPGVRLAVEEAPVALIDLYPTLMEMAGIDYAEFAGKGHYPETLDGESLMPQLTDGVPRRRDWAFSEYHGDRCCTGTYMLRRGPWKYIKYIGYEPQLFHLERDPWETTDVCREHADVAGEMERILAEHFDCDGIDARAKAYDRESFREWRRGAGADGTYAETMAHVYSGFDRQCIEDIVPWTSADEDQISEWLAQG